MANVRTIKLAKLTGDSTYELAVKSGKFNGTIEEFLSKEQTAQVEQLARLQPILDNFKGRTDRLVKYKKENSSVNKNFSIVADRLDGVSADELRTHLSNNLTNYDKIKGNLPKIDSLTNEIDKAYKDIKGKLHESIMSRVEEDLADKMDVNDSLVDWTQFMSLYRDTDIYGVEFDVKTTGQMDVISSTGTKTLANANLLVVPASLSDYNRRDDYDTKKLFRHWDVNAYVDKNGFKHITAIDGDGNFDRYTKDTYVMYPTWYIKMIPAVGKWITQVSGVPKPGFVPYPAAINPDGTVSPYMLFAKYAMDNQGRSVSNSIPMSWLNYSTATKFIQETKGSQYSIMTMTDYMFLQLLFMIKYATLDSKSVMPGVVSYFDNVAVSERGNTKTFTISEANGNNVRAGGQVRVYNIGPSSTDQTNNDKDNIALSDSCTIKTVTYDSTNKVYKLTFDETFNATSSTRIASMPWKTGHTDLIPNSDGYYQTAELQIYSMNPSKIGGIEYDIGALMLVNELSVAPTANIDDDIDLYIPYDCRKVIVSDSIDNPFDETTMTKVATINSIVNPAEYYQFAVNQRVYSYQYGYQFPERGTGSSTTGYTDSSEFARNHKYRQTFMHGSGNHGMNSGIWWTCHTSTNVWFYDACTRISCNGVSNPFK